MVINVFVCLNKHTWAADARPKTAPILTNLFYQSISIISGFSNDFWTATKVHEMVLSPSKNAVYAVDYGRKYCLAFCCLALSFHTQWTLNSLVQLVRLTLMLFLFFPSLLLLLIFTHSSRIDVCPLSTRFQFFSEMALAVRQLFNTAINRVSVSDFEHLMKVETKIPFEKLKLFWFIWLIFVFTENSVLITLPIDCGLAQLIFFHMFTLPTETSKWNRIRTAATYSHQHLKFQQLCSYACRQTHSHSHRTICECCYHCSSSQYFSVLILALPLKLNNCCHSHTPNSAISFFFCNLFDEIQLVLRAWQSKICLNFICCARHKFCVVCCVFFIHHFACVILLAVCCERESIAQHLQSIFILCKFLN